MTMIAMRVLSVSSLENVEPNATPLTAQFPGRDLFVDDCVAVDGSLFDPARCG